MGLFDKTTINRHYHDTSIIEKRAPTDESVRLLKEMEEKAESKFLSRIELHNNYMDISVCELVRNYADLDRKFYYGLKLNGESIGGIVEITELMFLKHGEMGVFKKVYEEVAKVISHLLIKSYVDKKES